ncbi:DUF5797 family protein [Halarchaeum acidiphilum]|nr:DUF5797 family protein [Halarchaeum acidiphilum]
MTGGDPPIQRVSVDRVDARGIGHHESSDASPLRLGPLPESVVGESLLVEIWGLGEGRVVDQRYRPEIEPPAVSMDRSMVESILAPAGELSSGDYVLGITEGFRGDVTPRMIAGGYRIQIPGTDEKNVVLARVKEARRKTFGANEASAVRVDSPSLFRTTTERGIGLRRLMADGKWREPIVSELELRTLEELVERVDNGRSASILYPGFDPDVSLQAAIELLYHARPRSNVALLTSGSSIQWGQKGEIRDAYRGYGLSTDPVPSEDVIPLNRVFSHGYVHGGEMKTSSGALLDRHLILTKDNGELSAIPNLTAIVVDYTSRKPGIDEETIERVRERFPNVPIVSIGSVFTKNERDGVPRYAPPAFFENEETFPSISDIGDVMGAYDPQVGRTTSGLRTTKYTNDSSGSPTSPITTDQLGLLREPTMAVTPVDSGDLSRWFELATERFEELLDSGVDRAGHKVYSNEMFYERLPVPVERYNDWIRDEWDAGKRFVPDTTDAVLDDLETYGGKIDDLQAPAHVFAAHKALSEIDSALREENPLFERVCEEVTDALDRGYRLGVFCPRKSWSHVLQEALVERGFSTDAIGSNVVLLDPDSIRDTPPCHRLVFTGPQRPQYAGFYFHPRATEVVVYTYDGRWEGTVARHAREYRQRLNVATSGSNAEPYPVPDWGDATDDVTSDVADVETSEDEESESEPSTDTTSSSSRREAIVESDSIDDEELHRLAQLVEHAPTKNRELADLWGYDSGSEVYQYLSTHLREYYERNEDKLIVPTAEGEQLVEERTAKR